LKCFDNIHKYTLGSTIDITKATINYISKATITDITKTTINDNIYK